MKIFAIQIFILMGFFFCGCGNTYSPQHYFENFINASVPESVKNLKASYSGFPQGYVVVTFKINDRDFYSLEVLKLLKEVDSIILQKAIEEFGGASFIKVKMTDYNKFHFYRDEATEKTRWHVTFLLWNSEKQNAYFFFI